MKTFYIDINLNNGVTHHYTVKARHRKSALNKVIAMLDLDNYDCINSLKFRQKEFN